MTRRLRYAALLGALSILPLGVAACGDDNVPGNAVVDIGGDTIKTSTFDHWLTVAATSQAQQAGATGVAQAPKPPEYTACIATKKKTAAKPAKGQPKPTDATYKAQCKQEYEALRNQMIQFLISSAWVEGESADRDVKVSDTEVKKEFDTQRQQSFPKDEDYTKFLKDSGYVQEDLLYRIRIQTLTNKLREKILKGSDKVSAAQISAYYNKNKSNFARPEQRDIRIVLTKTEARAKEAKAALDDGGSWTAVAKRFSIDQGTKSTGGLLQAVPKGQQEKALDDATFKAAKGKVSGPVKTQFGFYVFEVVKVTALEQQTLEQSRESIKQLLVNQAQQKKLNDFVAEFQKKWRARTDCRKGYVTADCANGPKASTATPAAPTQGAAPADSGASTDGR